MDLNAEELYMENINGPNFPFDDEIELSFLERLNIRLYYWNQNEQRTVFWNRACIHPRNCDESSESMQEMITRFQKNPGNLSREFRGHSALSEALLAGHAKCVEFIIKNHTDRSKLMSIEDIFLFGVRAPERKFRGILELLIKNDMFDWSRVYDTDEFEVSVCAALRVIAEEDRVEALLCMIDSGLPLDPPNSMECRTPLVTVICNPRLSCYKILLLAGARNRFTFYPDDDEGNENRVRVEFPIPMVLVTTTISCFVDRPDQLIPMLKIFREFGGNLWAKAERDFKSDLWYTVDGMQEKTSVCKAGQNVLDFLKSDPDLLAKFPPGTIEELQQMMATPLSLVELARVNIWKNYGRDYLKNIPHFWIPRELQRFLKF